MAGGRWDFEAAALGSAVAACLGGDAVPNPFRPPPPPPPPLEGQALEAERRLAHAVTLDFFRNHFRG